MAVDNNAEQKRKTDPQDATQDEMEEEAGRSRGYVPLNSGRRPSRGSGGMGGVMSRSGYVPFVVIAVIAAIVSYGVLSFAGPNVLVSKADFTTNLGNIGKDIADLKTKDTSLGSQFGSVSTTVTGQGNTLSTQGAQITAVDGKVTALTGQVQGIQGNINTQITSAVTSQLGSVARKPDIDALQSQIAKLNDSVAVATKGAVDLTTKLAATQKQNDDQDKVIKDLQTKIAGYGTTTTGAGGGFFGGSNTATGTVTPGQVTASIMSGPWSTSSVMTFGSIASNSTAAQSFTIQIANGLDRTINNIQLAIGLELMDSNNTPLTGPMIPYADPANFTLSSFGITGIWTYQSTGYPYFLGFSNTAATPMFGGMAQFAQAPGITNYTMTVSIKNPSGAASYQTVNILPIVKVTYYQ